MTRENMLAKDIKSAIKTIRVLRHEVRVKLELARIRPSDEWRNLEMQLHDLEKATEPASEALRAAVVEGVRKLEKFDASLPFHGL
jgi:hypothetical protein